MCFCVSSDEVDLSPDRSFTLARNVAVDSAVAANHLRNCTASAEGFGIEFDGRAIADSVALWTSGLLRSAENFRFAKLDLDLAYVHADGVLDFMVSTRDALLLSTAVNGLCGVWLQTGYLALEALVTAQFLQWPCMQSLEHIHLEMVGYAERRTSVFSLQLSFYFHFISFHFLSYLLFLFRMVSFKFINF